MKSTVLASLYGLQIFFSVNIEDLLPPVSFRVPIWGVGVVKTVHILQIKGPSKCVCCPALSSSAATLLLPVDTVRQMKAIGGVAEGITSFDVLPPPSGFPFPGSCKLSDAKAGLPLLFSTLHPFWRNVSPPQAA